MSSHSAEIQWTRGDAPFLKGRYSRAHEWRFDGGSVVAASASPAVVSPPWSRADAVDPEEAFVAALSSCHMLWFLALAAEAGHVVDRYVDRAVGHLDKDSEGRLAITEVVLRPHAAFAPDHAPDAAGLDALHHAAHAACFLAHSVRSEVRIEPQ